MKIKRFFAKDMRTALSDVKAALGADAVIMSNKRVNGGVEIVAAIDPDSRRPEAKPAAQPAAATARSEATAAEAEPADSLQALLQRQAKMLGEERRNCRVGRLLQAASRKLRAPMSKLNPHRILNRQQQPLRPKLLVVAATN